MLVWVSMSQSYQLPFSWNMAHQLVDRQTEDFIDTLDESHYTFQFILKRWGHKPLHAAVFAKKYDIVRVLMVGGIDIEKQDEDGNTALHVACLIGNYDMAVILTTQYGAPITQKYLDQLNHGGQSCLHIGAYQNRWDLIHLLVSGGASINVRETISGGTPLHTAVAFRRKLAIVYILKYCKPNLGMKNCMGYTANDIARIILRKDIITPGTTLC